MVILLMWELHPEETSFHLVPYREELMQLHGIFLNSEDCLPEHARLIETLDREKGDPTPSCDISDMGVTHFLQTGILL